MTVSQFLLFASVVMAMALEITSYGYKAVILGIEMPLTDVVLHAFVEP